METCRTSGWGLWIRLFLFSARNDLPVSTPWFMACWISWAGRGYSSLKRRYSSLYFSFSSLPPLCDVCRDLLHDAAVLFLYGGKLRRWALKLYSNSSPHALHVPTSHKNFNEPHPRPKGRDFPLSVKRQAYTLGLGLFILGALVARALHLVQHIDFFSSTCSCCGVSVQLVLSVSAFQFKMLAVSSKSLALADM